MAVEGKWVRPVQNILVRSWKFPLSLHLCPVPPLMHCRVEVLHQVVSSNLCLMSYSLSVLLLCSGVVCVNGKHNEGMSIIETGSLL